MQWKCCCTYWVCYWLHVNNSWYIICRYSPQSVLNFYKTGLFLQAVSDKKLAERGKEYKGRKLPKERLNVMMCCSSTREKRIPLVIGKARKPRCFATLDPTKLPIIWRINQEILDDRRNIQRLGNRCKQRNEKKPRKCDVPLTWLTIK